jgi:hypothetical protein
VQQLNIANAYQGLVIVDRAVTETILDFPRKFFLFK